MPRARKSTNADEEPAAAAEDMPAEAEMSIDTTPPPTDGGAPPVEQPTEINPFPRVVKVANFGQYSVRLLQDQQSNEMQIRFGDGRPQDKPSDDVLRSIRSHRVPEELKTRKERESNKDVAWFQFSTEKGAWCMWLRNQPHTARVKAEQVFDEVVGLVAQEWEASLAR